MQVSHLIFRYAVCYLSFFIIALVSKSNEGFRLFDENGSAKNAGALQGFQIIGILWLGVIPFYILNFSFAETVFGKNFPGLLPVFILVLLTVISIFFSLSESQVTFRKILNNKTVVKAFSLSFLIRYFLLRILFLIGYEIFFRGYLLLDSISYFGTTIAIVVNVALYTFLHLPGGKKEMSGCIFFGTLLCLMCLWFQSALPAIMLHLSFAVVYEINLAVKFSKPLKLFL